MCNLLITIIFLFCFFFIFFFVFIYLVFCFFFFFFQAEDGIRDDLVTGVQTCALPILGVFVGHPHLVVVPNEVGAREILACSLVPGANSTSTEGGGRPSTPSGPMGNAVVDIAASDVVTLRSEPADVKLEVTDRRPKIVMERTALGHKAMSGVVLRPTETELVKAIMITELREAVAAQANSANGPSVACDITEFSITTPATVMYWDVTADIALTLRAGNQQRVVTGRSAKRTYAWPSESLIKAATVEALKGIAAQ